MAKQNKILSNIVGLAAAREVCQGYLADEIDTRTGKSVGGNPPSPFDARWKKYAPNTYADTGATITTTAPNPISETRQRNKGIVTDLEASIGFNHNVSATNMNDMFEAALFANTRKFDKTLGGNTKATSGEVTENGQTYAVSFVSYSDASNGDESFIRIPFSSNSERDEIISNFPAVSRIRLSGLKTKSQNGDFDVEGTPSVVMENFVDVPVSDGGDFIPLGNGDGTGLFTSVTGVVAVALMAVPGTRDIISEETSVIAPAAGGISMQVTDEKEVSLTSLTGGSNINFSTLGLEAGDWVFVGGDDNGGVRTSFSCRANNGFKRVAALRDDNGDTVPNPTATKLVFDKGNGNEESEITLATGSGNTNRCIKLFLGDTLQNGLVRPNNTFQFERTLGNSDGGAGNNQSELITGCVLNEVSINFPASGLVNADLGFVAKDQKLLSDGDEDKAERSGTLTDELLKKDILNTVSDISRMNLSRVASDGSIIQGSDFFNFVTEASLTINNGVTPDKALSVLGSFDYSIGNFIVSGSLQAYFANVDAVRAVRENADVTLDYALVKENAGIVFDLPLITLGDGRLNVEEGQSIRLPLNTEAANAEKHGLPYTMKIVFFPYLPNLADSV